jgi:hypothetical protein
MKVLMHALAASCEELRARTGNPPLEAFEPALQHSKVKWFTDRQAAAKIIQVWSMKLICIRWFLPFFSHLS